MFYETRENKHGLARDPFKALIAPRPIGWITTLGNDGICNIAPYSFFNALSEKPHYVVIGSAGRKDTLRNIEETGDFTCSLATWELRDEMNVTSAPFPHGDLGDALHKTHSYQRRPTHHQQPRKYRPRRASRQRSCPGSYVYRHLFDENRQLEPLPRSDLYIRLDVPTPLAPLFRPALLCD